MAILITTLTATEGTGAFDLLMDAAQAHLDEQYSKGRIKGPEYAQVYLGMMNSVMSQALQFVLSQEKVNAETELLEGKILNEVKQGELLDKQVCKLNGEFDALVVTALKITAETSLLDQKLVTEQAQTTALNVDADSVVGRQKSLYDAQTNGYLRNAEQKAAGIMADSWNIQRTTDETGTVANDTNKMDAAAVGRAITKLLDGVNA